MLKTIKTTKIVDFFELVKGVQTGIYKHGDYRVVGRNEGSVWVDKGGFILEEPDNKILFTDSFKVEEPITEDTVFDELMCVYKRETLIKVHQSSINGIFKSNLEDEVNVHALINGRLELVWESDENE